MHSSKLPKQLVRAIGLYDLGFVVTLLGFNVRMIYSGGSPSMRKTMVPDKVIKM